MPSPLISVLIPAFNAGRTIDRALASVFAQHYHPIEIIVIDDGSTDDTVARVVGYGGEVRLLKQRPNRGVAAATNAGLVVAKGEFIAFLDADDEWLPGKLPRQVTQLAANPDMSLVGGGWREVDLSGRVWCLPDLRPADWPGPGRVWRELLARAFILKSTVIARSAHLSKVGRFDETLPVAEDQDMWIRLALVGQVGWLWEPLAVHYQIPHSLTQRYKFAAKDFVLPMIAKHVRAQRQSLAAAEIRWIFGMRYAQAGRSLYQGPRCAQGLYYLCRAVLLGVQPATHLKYMIAASPPARWLKNAVAWFR